MCVCVCVCVCITCPDRVLCCVSPVAPLPAPARFSWTPQQEVPVWDISSCSLQDGQILITRDEEHMTRTRNRVSSCLSNLSLQNLTEDRGPLEGSHDSATTGQRPKSTEGGVKGRIIRRLKQVPLRKSSSQLNIEGRADGPSPHGSRESLAIPVSAADSLDLSSDRSTVVRPVHSSILGEKYCFEVINSEGSHCFNCSSAAERDRWIENLRRAAQPNKDNCERTENALSLWVNDAKDLQPKKRYYCELHLDGTLWGELFELDNLPPVSQVTLHLFRDEEPKKKGGSGGAAREDTHHPLGSVAIPLAQISGRVFQESWYRLVPYAATSGSAAGSSQASIRVKARFQNLRVLPIERYKEFAEQLTFRYAELCHGLEPLLSVREKEELAGALVHVLQSVGKAKEFLAALGQAELQRCGDRETLIFRENTLATKAIDEYMKLVGQKYLIDTLGEFVGRICTSTESWEADPKKCHPSELQNNQKNLREGCEEAFQKITETYSSFPVELNEIFSVWREDCEVAGRGAVLERMIGASLFLRFLCPALLSPSLFGLAPAYPGPPALRALTLTAKVIQNLANFTPFGEKEEYMLFMNGFLESHWGAMRGFVSTVSSPDGQLDMARFDGYVDLPLRLAVLHRLLTHILSTKDQVTIDQLHPLPSILNRISDCLGPTEPRIAVSCSLTEPSKPCYVPPKDFWEADPKKCHPSELQNNQKNLREGCEEAFQKITETYSSFPVELNEIFSVWREDCEVAGRGAVLERMIGASLFLRFLCPALLSPSLFGLAPAYPGPPALRALTLTAKVIQNLANFTPFGEKEEYMLFMNGFLESHWGAMRGFVSTVSSPDGQLDMARFDGYVDLPLRLAVLHRLLTHILSTKDQRTQSVPERDRTRRPPPRRQISTENLSLSQQDLQGDVGRTDGRPLDITLPSTRQVGERKTQPAPVPWIRDSERDSALDKAEHQDLSLLDKHEQELCELRVCVDQVTERDLELAKRLEDFIAQSQDQHALLQAELQELRGQLAAKEEELATATFRWEEGTAGGKNNTLTTAPFSPVSPKPVNQPSTTKLYHTTKIECKTTHKNIRT
ncbi:DAB2P protein, partial [Amia calva]|nr:DAB2P protein [Amia calva]